MDDGEWDGGGDDDNDDDDDGDRDDDYDDDGDDPHVYPSSCAFPVTAIIRSPSVATILEGSWMTWKDQN